MVLGQLFYFIDFYWVDQLKRVVLGQNKGSTFHFHSSLLSFVSSPNKE